MKRSAASLHPSTLQNGSPSLPLECLPLLTKDTVGPWPTCSRSTRDLLPRVVSTSLIRRAPVTTLSALARLRGLAVSARTHPHSARWAGATDKHLLQNKCV